MNASESSEETQEEPEAPAVHDASIAPCEGQIGPSHTPVSVARATAEFLVVLLIGILFVRTYAAEAYIVPTGSMAPVLLGQHLDYACPNCGNRFAVGIDEQGHTGRPACPNCGHLDWAEAAPIEGVGDRLLVQKYLFDLRPPRRWESAVFQNPADPTQAYVKRVVGLPGESILIHNGDVFIDGKIARKSLAEQRALRIPVYDNRFVPKDADRYPRLIAHRGWGRRALPSGWNPAGTSFVHSSTKAGAEIIDWLEYRHWQADRGTYGPVRDFLAYNGVDLPGENRADDLTLEAEVAVGPEVRALVLRLSHAGDRFQVSIPCDGKGPVEVRRSGRYLPVEPKGVKLGPAGGRSVHVEASLVDRRLTVALDGRLLFEPLDYDEPSLAPPALASPVALGILGVGWAEVSNLKISRDVYYTDALANAPRRPFGVDVPYQLRAGEFFVLGDNSAVSNDSRFWPESPVVRRGAFLGKPFLVHLPSQAVPLRVFGRDFYWIPDPREIRYIR